MMSMSILLGKYWNWVEYQQLAPNVSLKQPQLSLAFADRGIFLQPLVQVQCSAYSSNTSLPEIVLPNDQLRAGRVDAYTNVTWPVASNYTDVDLSKYIENLYWSYIPVDGYENAPSTGLIFIMPDDEWTRTVVPCSVVTSWVPSTELSVFPKTDRNIYDGLSNSLDDLNNSNVGLSPPSQISFSDDWCSLLITGGDPTFMDSVIHGITMVPCSGYLNAYLGGKQGLAYRVSTMVGMFLTDGIARYVPPNMPETSHMIFQDSRNGTPPFAQQLGGFEVPHEAAPAGYSTCSSTLKNIRRSGEKRL